MVDSLQRPNAAGQAHKGHRTTPDEPTTGGHENGEPTQCAGHAPVTTQPPHRTGRPQQTSELTERTTQTTFGYTNAGCSAIDPTRHKPAIRRLPRPGTNQTAAENRPNNKLTARNPANTKSGRHARVETGMAFHGLATP